MRWFDRFASRLFRWQILTAALMIIGYSGYYFCRSNLSVCTVSIAKELSQTHGISEGEARKAIGAVVSLSILAYAIGKFCGGGLADFLGGRRNYLIGMAGSILCTLAFALGGGLPIFSCAWFANRLFQSMGWTGMMKISSRWFSYSSYGTAVGIISVSYLFGDAIARWFMGLLLDRGVDWRGVFMAVAGILAVVAVINAAGIRESPTDIGEKEPDANPGNLFGDQGPDSRPSSLLSLIAPMLRSPAFGIVCLLSFGFTFLRETFNSWIPTYFQDVLSLPESRAASLSALFPLLGGVSVLLAGFLSDRLGRGGRSFVLLAGLGLTTLALGWLGWGRFGDSSLAPVALVAAIGFVMIGPYSYLGGAIALDFGGKQGSATACGLIDGIGYLGGIFSGWTVAAFTKSYGWTGTFLLMTSVAAASALASLVYHLGETRKPLDRGDIEIT